MKNSGFTLIEMVSMTIVISVMTLVSTPLISKELNEVKKEETIDACYLVKQTLKAYYYKNNLDTTQILDLANLNTQKELGIENTNISSGQAIINANGQITSELIINNFTCTISGNTEEISCS